MLYRQLVNLNIFLLVWFDLFYSISMFVVDALSNIFRNGSLENQRAAQPITKNFAKQVQQKLN